MKTHRFWPLLVPFLVIGCGERPGSTTLPPPEKKPTDAGGGWEAGSLDATPSDAGGPDDGAFVFRTGDFQLAPGQERYLCFAKTLEEDLTIGAYSADGQPFVHHVIFARTRAPEPDGFSECNTGFRTSWDPLFITGAGTARLDFPSDAGHVLPKGTQLLAQLHLLNLASQPITATAAIKMHRSTASNPRPVNSYIFGTMDVNLPPMQTSEVVGQCTVREPIKLIAAFPHMHILGRALRFEVGKTADAMNTIFRSDPFDFNNQRIDPLEFDLVQGDMTRLTCKFENTNLAPVTYGESTLNEMCYLIGFAVDRAKIGGCIQ